MERFVVVHESSKKSIADSTSAGVSLVSATTSILIVVSWRRGGGGLIEAFNSS